jgi:hypothetical protein
MLLGENGLMSTTTRLFNCNSRCGISYFYMRDRSVFIFGECTIISQFKKRVPHTSYRHHLTGIQVLSPPALGLVACLETEPHGSLIYWRISRLTIKTPAERLGLLPRLAD